MSNIKMVIKHNLEQEEAVKRMLKFHDEVKNLFGCALKNLSETWDEKTKTSKFSFSVASFSFMGELTVEQAEVIVFIKLPFFCPEWLGDRIKTGLIQPVIKALQGI